MSTIESLIDGTNQQVLCQILDLVKIENQKQEGFEKYRGIISDGAIKIKCIFANDSIAKIQRDNLKKYDLIQTLEVLVTHGSKLELIIISDYTLLYNHVEQIIGSPIDYRQYLNSKTKNNDNANNNTRMERKYTENSEVNIEALRFTPETLTNNNKFNDPSSPNTETNPTQTSLNPSFSPNQTKSYHHGSLSPNRTYPHAQSISPIKQSQPNSNRYSSPQETRPSNNGQDPVFRQHSPVESNPKGFASKATSNIASKELPGIHNPSLVNTTNQTIKSLNPSTNMIQTLNVIKDPTPISLNPYSSHQDPSIQSIPISNIEKKPIPSHINQGGNLHQIGSNDSQPSTPSFSGEHAIWESEVNPQKSASMSLSFGFSPNRQYNPSKNPNTNIPYNPFYDKTEQNPLKPQQELPNPPQKVNNTQTHTNTVQTKPNNSSLTAQPPSSNIVISSNPNPTQVSQALPLPQTNTQNSSNSTHQRIANIPQVNFIAINNTSKPKEPFISFNRNSLNQKSNSSSKDKQESKKFLNYDKDYILIRHLIAYQDFTLKVRIIKKTEIMRPMNKFGKQIRVFSIDLLDEEGGQIQGSFFNESLDKWFDKLEEGKIYLVSQGQVEPAKSKIPNYNNTYHIKFTVNSIFQEIPDDIDLSIPIDKFKFIKISEIINEPVGALVDVACLILTIGNIQKSQFKSGETKERRAINLVDDTNTMIELTLWGEKAINFTAKKFDIIMVKNARIGEYNNRRNLVYVFTTQLYYKNILNNEPRIQELQQWSQENDLDLLQFQFSTTHQENLQPIKYRLLAQIEDEFQNDKLISHVKASISYIRTEGYLYYIACPTCQKKVEDHDDGKWFCQACEIILDNPVAKYNLTISLADDSGSLWVNCFDKPGELILRMSAQDLKQLKDEEQNVKIFDILKKPLFEEYDFTILSKQEIYLNELKIKHQILDVIPINFAYESKQMLDILQGFNDNNGSYQARLEIGASITFGTILYGVDYP